MNVNTVSLFFIVISAGYCEGRISPLNGTVTNVSRGLPDIYDPSQYFSVPGSTALFIEKCKKNSMWPSFLDRNPYSEEERKCQINLLDKNVLLDNAQSGQTRDGIKRFCAKTPQFKECANTLVEGLRPCLSAEESPYLDNYRDGEHQLYDFLCYNNGERIIRFLEEGGPECVQKQEKPVKSCFTAMKKLPISEKSNALLSDNMFQGPVVKELCTEFLELKSCAVDALRRCERQEHADFVDSLTDIKLRATPCKDQMPSKGLGAGAVVAIVVGVVLLVALAAGGYLWWRRHSRAASGNDPRRGAGGGGPGAVGLL